MSDYLFERYDPGQRDHHPAAITVGHRRADDVRDDSVTPNNEHDSARRGREPSVVICQTWVPHGYRSSMKAAPIMTVGKMAHRNNFTAEIPSSPNRETRID